MNILWITNTIFPKPCEYLNLDIPVIGGWMYSLAEQLISKNQDIKLSVATVYTGSDLKSLEIDNIIYYLLPSKKKRYNKKLEDLWRQVVYEFKPDVVHIQGTEYAHGLACINGNPQLNYIISIQGLVSICERYYLHGLNFRIIFNNITFRDIIKQDNLWQQRKDFFRRGLLEKEYIKKTQHIIGRTSWDSIHSQIINPNIQYHFCNESLRNSFYSAQKWDIKQCEKYTIFLSQAGYPIKGLHQIILAVKLLIRYFTKIKIYIGGYPITNNDSLSDKLRLSGYGKIIKSLLKKHRLESHFIFLGNLDEHKMIIQYQKAHVFVCPSTIENSPNSIGEAQLIGTPCVASYVGGVPDMIQHGDSGLLYRFEEVEMLANYIKEIFENDTFAIKLSKKSISIAEKRHDRVINTAETLKIYKTSINNANKRLKIYF